jgi:hypothetical protein
LAAAGWTDIPISYAASFWAGFRELLRGETFKRFPPMTTYKVAGRLQDMNWAKIVTPFESRHHFRLWKTGWTDARGRDLWWGTGNFDLSVRWRDLSHRVDPDMNAERAYIAASLKGVPGLVKSELVALPQIPLSGANECGYEFKTDGRALWLEFGP